MMLLVKRLVPEAKLPTRATPGSAGYDLYATETVQIAPFGYRAVATGISIVLPEGTYGRVAPRSGLAAKQGIDVLAGVIDPDYTGEIKVILSNYSAMNGSATICAGDRIAQLVIERCETPTVIEVSEVEETERGAGGFGSTGH